MSFSKNDKICYKLHIISYSCDGWIKIACRNEKCCFYSNPGCHHRCHKSFTHRRWVLSPPAPCFYNLNLFSKAVNVWHTTKPSLEKPWKTFYAVSLRKHIGWLLFGRFYELYAAMLQTEIIVLSPISLPATHTATALMQNDLVALWMNHPHLKLPHSAPCSHFSDSTLSLSLHWCSSSSPCHHDPDEWWGCRYGFADSLHLPQWWFFCFIH